MSRSRRNRKQEADTAVRRYANALVNAAAAWDRVYEAEGGVGDARPGSSASVEGEELAERFTEFDEPPGLMIEALLSTKIEVALDHLRGTERLMVAKKTGVFSVWATTRAAVEALAEVYWLTDPDISAEERLGRVINTRLDSLRGAQRLIEKGEIPEEQVLSDPWERERELVERLRAMDCDVRGTAKRGWYVEPERPTLTELVDRLGGPGLYSLMSGMAHTELWATQHHLRAVAEGKGPAGEEREVRQFQVSVEEYRLLALRLIRVFGETVVPLARYLGWDDSDLKEALVRAARDVDH